jgi:type I restriction enzyme M protein
LTPSAKTLKTNDFLSPSFLLSFDTFPIQTEGYKGHFSKLSETPIPLPPFSNQRQILVELEAERKLVKANRDLIARMETKIKAKLAEVWGEG